MPTALVCGLAALAAIAGCHAFWSWWRLAITAFEHRGRLRLDAKRRGCKV